MRSIGRYRIQAEVARGGMGTVFRASGPMGERAAVKLLSSGGRATPTQRRRFETEVQALLRVRHPHVVSLLDAGLEGNEPWLALEWVEGETLTARLEREGPLAPARAIEVTIQLAEALAHCHAQGVLHRDLKPDNVLLRAADDAPLLIWFGFWEGCAPQSPPGTSSPGSLRDPVRLVPGFGLARDASIETGERLTREGGLLGTPGWWPPEQARGDLAAVGPRSDVYGLAALLFGMLTARPPQEGADLQELLLAAEAAPPRPSRFVRGLPRWLDDVVTRGMAPDPGARPGSPLAFAGQLRGRSLEPEGRSARLAVGAAAALLAALVVGAATWGPAAPAEAPLPTPSAESGAGEAGLPLPAAASDAALEALLAEGKRRLEAEDLDGALQVCADALERDPEAAGAFFLRGQARFQRGEVAAALEDFERALARQPDHAEALVNRGILRERRGQVAEALRDFERAVRAAPHLALARNNRGWLRSRQGNAAGALEDFDKALELDPQLGLAWANRGALRDQQGDTTGARADYDRALELLPDHAATWGQRGWLRHRLGDLTGAIADYTEAIRLAPAASALALSNRADAYARRGRHAEARADHDRAVAAGPRQAMVWNNRGWYRAQRGDHAGALEDYAQALKLQPRLAKALLNRAVLLVQRRAYLLARNDLDRVLTLQPGHPAALHLRGIAREKLGDRAGARSDQAQALQRAPRARWAASAQEALQRLKE